MKDKEVTKEQLVEELKELTRGQLVEELKEYGWTAVPDGVWFGIDYAEAHKANVLNTLTDLLNLDPDVEGYDFLVTAYKKTGDK